MKDGVVDVLVIVGSPHREGKSTELARSLEETLNARGIAPTFYQLAEYPVAACYNCGYCQATGKCQVTGDGWGVLARHMLSADLVFVVAPVYFAGPSAHLKAMLDRCQVFWARKYVLKAGVPEPKPCHLIVVGDGGDPFGSEPLETICTSALNCANLRIGERIHRFIGDDFRLERAPEIINEALAEIGWEGPGAKARLVVEREGEA